MEKEKLPSLLQEILLSQIKNAQMEGALAARNPDVPVEKLAEGLHKASIAKVRWLERMILDHIKPNQNDR